MQWVHKWIGRTLIRAVEGGRPWIRAIPRRPGAAASDGYLDETFVTKALGPGGRYWRGGFGSFRPCFPGCAIGERPRRRRRLQRGCSLSGFAKSIFLLLVGRIPPTRGVGPENNQRGQIGYGTGQRILRPGMEMLEIASLDSLAGAPRS